MTSIPKQRLPLRARRLETLRITLSWVVVLAVVALPLYLVILTAMKPSSEAQVVSLDWPTQFALFDNLATVIREGRSIQGFLNSVLIAVPSITLCLLFSAMAAWVFGRANRAPVQAIYYLLISGVMLPPAVIATVKLLQALGIYNTQYGLILFYSGALLSGAIFLMTGFVRGIPYEIEEAARIDGAGPLRIFVSIILPTLRPVILTAGISLLLAVWNDFFSVFFLLPQSSFATLPIGLYNFAAANEHQLNWNLIFTQIILVSLPLLVAFLFAQKRIVSGLLSGAGK